MRFFSRGLTITCILILVSSSFLLGPPILNGINFNKQYWIAFFISVFSIVWILYLWSKNESLNFQFSLLDGIIVLLLIDYSLFAIYQKSSLLIHCLPFYYVLYFFVSKLVLFNLSKSDFENSRQFFINIVPLIILAHIGIIIIQRVGLAPLMNSSSPQGSTFGNPDMLGAYIVVLLPFCFIQKRSMRLFGYAVFLLSLVILTLIQARSAVLAIAICGFVWLLLNKPMKMKAIIILLVMLGIILFMLIIWHPESVYGRLFIWFVSMKMIILKPLGWGLFAFEKHLPEFQSSYLSVNETVASFISPEVVHSPFNEFINVGVTLGLLGLILFIFLVGLILNYGITSKDHLFYPALAFLIISLFYFPFKISPLVSLIIPILALISIRSHNLLQRRLPYCFYKVSLVLILLTASFMTKKSMMEYTHYKQWQEAYSLSLEPDNFVRSKQIFSELYPTMKSNGRFLITYANLEYSLGNYEESLQLLEKAETYFCDITLMLKLAKLYEMLGFYEKAERKFDLAINLAPNSMIAPYEKILFYQNIGEYKKAYNVSIELISKPIRSSSFADPSIIRNRLKILIMEYEQCNSE